jgi:GntR family transcriptional regulator
MKRIDKGNRLPLYHQLVDIIVNEIESGRLREDDKLPSERELCEKYNISRATVRQAILELERNGLVFKKHGKGTYISKKALKQDLLKFYSFSEEMKKLGKKPTSIILDFEIVKCNKKIASKLSCATGDEIYKIIRLRLADNEPMMYETTYLPCCRFPDFDKNYIEKRSMYDVFRKRYNISFSKAEEKLKPVITKQIEAKLLDVDISVPSMRIERFTYEVDKIIEYTSGIVRGDRFEYRVVLK